MHIVIEPVNISTIKAIIVITTDKYFVRIIKVTKPIHEVYSFLLAAIHGKIVRMHQYVCIR